MSSWSSLLQLLFNTNTLQTQNDPQLHIRKQTSMLDKYIEGDRVSWQMGISNENSRMGFAGGQIRRCLSALETNIKMTHAKIYVKAAELSSMLPCYMPF